MTITIENRIIQTRTFSVSNIDQLETLLREMKRQKFSGKLVVMMSQGGLNAVTAEETKRLPHTTA